MLSSLTRRRSWPECQREVRSLLYRLAHFFVVWSGLLFIHEIGHAWMAQRHGHSIGSTTIGAGPLIWRGTLFGDDVAFRLVPVVGITRVTTAGSASSESLASKSLMFGAGIIFTAAAGLLVALLTADRKSVV